MPLTSEQCDRLHSVRMNYEGNDDGWKVKFRQCIERWRNVLLHVEYTTFQTLLAYDYGDHLCCQDADFTAYVDSLSPDLYAEFGPASATPWVWPSSSRHASGLAH
jgi:hypothetical protein